VSRIKLGLVGLALGFIWLLLSTVGGSAASYYDPGSTGYDVSFPQCSSRLPRDGDFAIVGVTRGLPWSANPCLKAQFQWADSRPDAAAFYVNTANPGPISQYWNRPGPKVCASPTSYSDVGCAYNYGWNAAEQAFQVAVSATSLSLAAGHMWWLDVETANSWNGSKATNSATIQGYIDYFRSRGVANVGVYSTGYQWGVITGGLQLAGVPNWVAGLGSKRAAERNCNAGFSGGPVWLTQYAAKGFDGNFVCSGAGQSLNPG
jgi:hypothetical protein